MEELVQKNYIDRFEEQKRTMGERGYLDDSSSSKTEDSDKDSDEDDSDDDSDSDEKDETNQDERDDNKADDTPKKRITKKQKKIEEQMGVNAKTKGQFEKLLEFRMRQ